MEMDTDTYNKLLRELLEGLEGAIQDATTELVEAVELADVPEDAVTEFTVKFDITRRGANIVSIDFETKNYHFCNSGSWEHKGVDPIDFAHKNYWEPIDITKEGPMFNNPQGEE